MALGLDIGRKQSHFLKGLEIANQFISLFGRSDKFKLVNKNKEKCGQIENIFYGVRLDIGRKYSHFLKSLEIMYQSIFLSVRSDNIKPVKKI